MYQNISLVEDCGGCFIYSLDLTLKAIFSLFWLHICMNMRPLYTIYVHFMIDFKEWNLSGNNYVSVNNYSYFRDRLKMWQFFSNEVSFIWLRPPTHPLQMKVWKTEYWCIINQTPPKNIGFRTMYSPYACHDKGYIYESLSFQNHRHMISSKCTYNSTSILYQ